MQVAPSIDSNFGVEQPGARACVMQQEFNTWHWRWCVGLTLCVIAAALVGGGVYGIRPGLFFGGVDKGVAPDEAGAEAQISYGPLFLARY